MVNGEYEEYEEYEEEDIFKYLSYVTVREGWEHLKGFFGAWLIFTVVCLVLEFLIDFSVSTTEPIWSMIPEPVLYVVAFAAFAWYFRGEEINFVFPKSFKLWLLLTSCVALFVIGGTILPTWASLPFYIAIMIGVIGLEMLARIGKGNFQKLSESPSNSS